MIKSNYQIISKTLSDERKEIEIITNEILNDANIIEPPIDPRKLAQDWGIKVHFVSFCNNVKALQKVIDAESFGTKIDQIDGFYWKSSNAIIVNNDKPINRQTFTIAHELAHYCLHQDYLQEKEIDVIVRTQYNNNDKPDEERQADIFAANLLLPKEIFNKYRAICHNDLNELSKIFLVSTECLKYRINNLDKSNR